MDYVVFGIGFGATILVLGLVFRDLGPRLRYRGTSDGDHVLPADQLVARVAWNRFCSALGAVLAIAGSLFVLATMVCILFMVSDSTGGWVMLGAMVLFFLVMLYWTWAFFDRFGSYGILPERPVEEIAPAQARPSLSVAEPNYARSDRSSPEPDIVGPMPSEVDAASENVDADDEVPIMTPEERLEQMEEPLDHGSASADLDAPSDTSKRPAGAVNSGEVESTASEPDDDADSFSPAPSDDENDNASDQHDDGPNGRGNESDPRSSASN